MRRQRLLTAKDIANQKFNVTWLRQGYVCDDVDEWIDGPLYSTVKYLENFYVEHCGHPLPVHVPARWAGDANE